LLLVAQALALGPLQVQEPAQWAALALPPGLERQERASIRAASGHNRQRSKPSRAWQPAMTDLNMNDA